MHDTEYCLQLELLLKL